MSNILVAYFSASGTTEKVAQKLASQIHADFFKIQPNKRTHVLILIGMIHIQEVHWK